MRAEVIAIGDELVTGQRLDTNTQWLGERLTELGLEVAFHTTVGDQLETNVAAFHTAIDRAEVVVSTGGLGPTADDLTRQALAAAAEVDLVQDDAALSHIRNLFARRGRAMPERNVVQAQLPRGSRSIPNPHGTAPGIEMTLSRPCCLPCRVFALPGVPAEMFPMWTATVAPAIAAAMPARRVIRHRRLKCFGVGESDLEAMLPDIIRRGRDPLVGITVSGATITLRITAGGPNAAACYKKIEPTESQIRDLLGDLVFGEEDDELEHTVVRLLLQRKQTLAVAEWATDGLVAQWLAEASAGHDALRAGVIVRNTATLRAMLRVDARSPDGADAATAREMARSIRDQTGADLGLAIAALPVGRPTPQLPVDPAPPNTAEQTGTLQFGLATAHRVLASGSSLAGHPAITKIRAAKDALNLLRLTMLRNP